MIVIKDRVIWAGCLGLFLAGGLFFQIFKDSLDGQAIALLLNLASALGTVGAVVAALYLSHKSESRLSRSELVRAELEAARVSPALDSLLRALDSAYARFIFDKDQNIDNDLFGLLRHLGQLAALIGRDNLGHMACLEQSCAHRIARAISNIEKIVVTVERIESVGWDHVPLMQKVFYHGEIYSSVDEARDLLLVAQRVCNQATNRGAPMPSGEEKYGNGWGLDTLDD
ncbi:hypothetical protein HBO01_23440 [Pseudomonas rhodesiae]|uniref:hypothetical protein n=1 Tax=Pseudomonas rhodesiae TaxID=76760 RepID=UPI001473BE09|nr:hypothetical protein [Pseudomonas rhodesiae]NMY81637.1 hypothetical protein [Pseudomonas rhodesiae]